MKFLTLVVLTVLAVGLTERNAPWLFAVGLLWILFFHPGWFLALLLVVAAAYVFHKSRRN